MLEATSTAAQREALLEATSTAAIKMVSPVEAAHTIGARPHNSGRPLLRASTRDALRDLSASSG